METILQRFAHHFVNAKYEDLPAEVVDQAKMLIIDLIGVSIAGLRKDFPRIMIDYLVNLGGAKEATLLGTNKKIPAVFAALGNGVSGHALDMDDGYRYGGLHSGITAIPAALASAEAHGRDGKSFLLSVVMGCEIVNRLAKAMNPSHLNRGFHTTGTIGVFGASAAAGVVAGLNEEEMVSAMGIAGLQSAGLMEILHNGAMMKPLHPGKSGMAGVLSVQLAKRGAKGPATVLEGKDGLFRAMADRVTLDELFQDLGKHYSICDHYVKFHAACRHTHPTIDGVLSIMREKALKFDDIESVRIATYPVAISFCGKNTLPGIPEAAKFNLQYSTAMAAYFGDLGEGRYTQAAIVNRDIQSLFSRISVESDPRWAEAYPRERGATIVIRTKRGGNLSAEVPLAKGEPENPASVEDIVSKFRQNTNWIGEKVTDELLKVLFALDRRNVADLTKAMRRIARVAS
ncbi:MAG TPA: MmgE/PrpD family protein [Syntrophales bacterium]|nr:MmgE/PrpD family protein [Syntrophales bacterium]